MRNILIRWLILTIAIGTTAALLPGVRFEGEIISLVVVAAIFGLFNTFVRPILTLLTCPIVILTLGLFTLVINTLLFMLTAWLIPALTVESFWSAFFASIIISIITTILSKFFDDDSDEDGE